MNKEEMQEMQRQTNELADELQKIIYDFLNKGGRTECLEMAVAAVTAVRAALIAYVYGNFRGEDMNKVLELLKEKQDHLIGKYVREATDARGA